MQELTVGKDSTRKACRQNHIGDEIPPMPTWVLRSLESLWEQTVREMRGVEQEGFWRVEKEFRDRLLNLGGQMLGEAIPAGVGHGYRGSSTRCRGCGKRMKFVNHRPRTVTTLVREVRLRRAYYHCADCGRGEVPLDEMLSLEGSSFSPGVREAICLVDAKLPFEQGRDLLERLSAVRVDKEEGRRLAEGKGEELERQTEQEVEKTWDPKKPIPREATEPAKRLYLSPDGTTIPTVDGWKDVKVGAVFTASIPKRGEDPEREKTRYVGTVLNAQELNRRLYVEALKMGLNEETEVVAIGDGAHWIWNGMEVMLPKSRVEIIDFYHASEKLWEVSRAVFGEENPKGKRWAEHWSRKLKKSDASKAIAAMRRLKPKSKAARETVRKAIHYYHGNQRRMRYREFRKKGYFIGSGVVESSCKHLIGARLKQAGMRWKKPGAQAILQLRLAVLNQRWDHLWSTRPVAHA